jgi:hypothetical protein
MANPAGLDLDQDLTGFRTLEVELLHLERLAEFL